MGGGSRWVLPRSGQRSRRGSRQRSRWRIVRHRPGEWGGQRARCGPGIGGGTGQPSRRRSRWVDPADLRDTGRQRGEGERAGGSAAQPRRSTRHDMAERPGHGLRKACSTARSEQSGSHILRYGQRRPALFGVRPAEFRGLSRHAQDRERAQQHPGSRRARERLRVLGRRLSAHRTGSAARPEPAGTRQARPGSAGPRRARAHRAGARAWSGARPPRARPPRARPP
jgi:hypothetical protein